MKNTTIQQFFKKFPNDDACLTHLFKVRFAKNHECPKCNRNTTWHLLKSERAFSCGNCGNHIHPCVGTIIEANVEKQSEIQSDELHSYKGLNQKGYTHNTVNHGAGQYVSKSGVTVNSIESFWSRLKLSIKGTHIHVSKKHLAKYAAEFEYRFNSRGCPELMLSELLTKFAK